jgi:polyhydroxybutyrate depolymerase
MHRREVLMSVLVGGCLLTQATTPAGAVDTEQVATDRGNVPLYLPSSPDPGTSLPLVVSLHGYTGNGTSHENYFNLRSRIDERQFMLCVPNGLTNSQGERFWNATDFCCDFEGQNPDDSGYLRTLIETIIADHSVDMDSIHVVGHSNGGFMSYRMACENADLVASIASLAGATFSDASDCSPDEPVHVLQIHGTNDTVIAYDGSCIPFFACYPGALGSIMLWSGYNQCSGDMETRTNLDLDGSISGAETSRTLITEGCSEHGACELWAINGGSHGPSFNSNFSRELVDWLLEHRRSSTVPCTGDLDGNLVVDGADLSNLLSVWADTSGDYDLDGDGIVGGGDLSILLGAWGACTNP